MPSVSSSGHCMIENLKSKQLYYRGKAFLSLFFSVNRSSLQSMGKSEGIFDYNLQSLHNANGEIPGEKENNKKACLMILQKVVDDPQSGSCPNVSYADVAGPVANYNPTGSPYAVTTTEVTEVTA